MAGLPRNICAPSEWEEDREQQGSAEAIDSWADLNQEASGNGDAKKQGVADLDARLPDYDLDLAIELKKTMQALRLTKKGYPELRSISDHWCYPNGQTKPALVLVMNLCVDDLAYGAFVPGEIAVCSFTIENGLHPMQHYWSLVDPDVNVPKGQRIDAGRELEKMGLPPCGSSTKFQDYQEIVETFEKFVKEDGGAEDVPGLGHVIFCLKSKILSYNKALEWLYGQAGRKFEHKLMPLEHLLITLSMGGLECLSENKRRMLGDDGDIYLEVVDSLCKTVSNAESIVSAQGSSSAKEQRQVSEILEEFARILTGSTAKNSLVPYQSIGNSSRYAAKSFDHPDAYLGSFLFDDSEVDKDLVGATDDIIKDSSQLLNILPEEIWRLISDKIVDPNDHENLGNSSPYFRQLLMNERVLFLFPKVWNILGPKFIESAIAEDDLIPDPAVPIAPKIICNSCGRPRGTQPYSDILNLRLVSKIWSNAVDKFIQNDSLDECRNEIVLRNQSEGLSRFWIDIFNFTEPERYTQFLRHFRETHENGPLIKRSPFVSGYARIGPEPEAAQVFNIPQLYGEHVLKCTLVDWRHGAPEELPPAMLHSRHRQTIELMPKLRQIFYIGDGLSNDVMNPELDSELLEEMWIRPMPFIKNIQLLNFAVAPSKICSSILRENRHISTLIAYQLRPEDDFDMYSFPLPNLKELCTEYRSEENFLKLAKMEFQLNLNHLELDIWYIPENFSIIFNEISKKFGNTLTDLKLAFKESEDGLKLDFQDDFHEMRLDLPRLKTFIFESKSFCSLDFLLPMENSLEHLKVSFWPDCFFGGEDTIVESVREKLRTGSGEGKIKLLSSIFSNGGLNGSNIWEVFPKLQKIEYLHGELLDGECKFVSWNMGRQEENVGGREYYIDL